MTKPLPPIDPSSPDEPLPGEAELAALYRQLPRSEPGPALDAAVLRAAAQALSAGEEGLPEGMAERRKLPREKLAPLPAAAASPATSPVLQSIEYVARTRRKRTPHWLIALGSAASLVLVAGLAWHMRETAQQALTPAASLVTVPSVVPSKPASKSPAPVTPRAMPGEAQPAVSRARKIADTPAMLLQQGKAASAVAAPSISGRSANSMPPAGVAARVSESSAASRQAATAQALGGMVTNADQAASIPQTAQAAAAPGADADTPAQELDQISQLFAQGHHAEALQRLRAFRQAHPQWPLPSALRERLGQP